MPEKTHVGTDKKRISAKNALKKTMKLNRPTRWTSQMPSAGFFKRRIHLTNSQRELNFTIQREAQLRRR